MAFERETDVTKDTIQDFRVEFFVPGPDNTEDGQSGTIEVKVGLSNDKFLIKLYDLIARLNDDTTGQAHLANLVSLRDYIRTRLNDEVLPLP